MSGTILWGARRGKMLPFFFLLALHKSRLRRKVLGMQKYKLALVVLAVLVVSLVGWYAWVFFQVEAAQKPDSVDQEALVPTVTVEGVVVKDGPNLKPGVWYVSFNENGKDVGVELLFDELSSCHGKTSFGRCNPDFFKNGRKARIGGTVEGEVLHVLDLTFTEPLKN